MRVSRSEFIPIRGLNYHVRHWGSVGKPTLFMMHGWMDVSASFQFVVDCLSETWHVIAPDWRGFGLTGVEQADSFWFPDYLGDLDAILNYYASDESVALLGHSMGGNVVSLYAGIRPHRVSRLINLEGFGMPVMVTEQAPSLYAKWLDELNDPVGLRTYATREDVIARLQKNNSRLTNERASFLADYWAAPNIEGRWEVLAHSAHKIISPLFYRVEEAMACWKAIQAPVLWVEAEDSDVWKWIGHKGSAQAEMDRRVACIPNVTRRLIQHAGHMLHHDQPEILAKMIEQFLAE